MIMDDALPGIKSFFKATALRAPTPGGMTTKAQLQNQRFGLVMLISSSVSVWRAGNANLLIGAFSWLAKPRHY